MRLGPVVVRIVRGQAVVDDSDDPLGPEESTVLGTLAERAGSVVALDALRQRLVARHGIGAACRLEEHVARVAGALAAAGGPVLHAVDDLGFVLQP